MQDSNIPSKFPVIWGAAAPGGDIHAVPTASQILITPGAASLTDGFPPLNFVDTAAGGVPMFGADMNGILNQIVAWVQWVNAGGPLSYDAAFSTAIGGYPKGAWLNAATLGSWWVSTADNNTTDPDTGGAGWQQVSFGQTYAGNPNTHVAGIAASSIGIANALLWDTTNKILWICTTTGDAAGAVWTNTVPVSSNTGKVAAVSGSGSITIGHPATFIDIYGTVADTGPGTPGPKGDTGAPGTPGASSIVLINTFTASNSANFTDTTSITASYTYYEIIFQNILSNGVGAAIPVLLEVSTDGGSTWSNLWITGEVMFMNNQNPNLQTFNYPVSGMLGYLGFIAGATLLNGAVRGSVIPANPRSTFQFDMTAVSSAMNAWGSVDINTSGSPINAIRLSISGYPMISGDIKIYGRV